MSAVKTSPRVAIIDFLLARIAEDEDSVDDSSGWYAHRWAVARSRLLAECEAKRAIVRIAQIDAAVDHWGIGLDSLRALAAVYSEHPEFRREWVGG